jgi:hypothetical protein
MSIRVLEQVVRRAGLAVRLLDLATGQPIREGIEVTAWPEARPELRVATTAVTGAGVAGFTRLPGLGSYEDGSTSRDDWFVSPVQHGPLPFIVRVDDTTGDHLRVVRPVLVPVAAPVDVVLPRSPAAPVPAANLTVVASVATEAALPAPWAVVELSVGGFTTGGIADARGTVVVPLPRAVPPTMPGSAASGPVWRVTVRVRWRLADQLTMPGAAADDPPTFPSLLSQQPALVVDGGALAGSLDRDLTTGGPLVVASLAPPSPSVLVIRPAP